MKGETRSLDHGSYGRRSCKSAKQVPAPSFWVWNLDLEEAVVVASTTMQSRLCQLCLNKLYTLEECKNPDSCCAKQY